MRLKQILLAGFCFLLISALFCGCTLGQRTPATAQEFTDRINQWNEEVSSKEEGENAQNAQVTIEDLTAGMEGSSVRALLIGDSAEYHFEFIVCTTNESAIGVFEENKSYLAQNTSFTAMHQESGGNYDIYIMLINQKYNVITRVDNTLLYATALVAKENASGEDDIDQSKVKDFNKLLKKLGYALKTS